MLKLHSNQQRGSANHGWLQSRHSFSFGHFYHPELMGFGVLRVINEDIVQPGKGFPNHAHQDMEIISYVLSGELQHRDSLGNGAIIQAGSVQSMSAGTGITHSEFNPSATTNVHFLQIWLEPKVKGLQPSYAEMHNVAAPTPEYLHLIASADGREGSVTIQQDACIYVAVLTDTQQTEYVLAATRSAYVHVIRGTLEVNGVKLSSGDGLMLSEITKISFMQASTAECLLFDLPHTDYDDT